MFEYRELGAQRGETAAQKNWNQCDKMQKEKTAPISLKTDTARNLLFVTTDTFDLYRHVVPSEVNKNPLNKISCFVVYSF